MATTTAGMKRAIEKLEEQIGEDAKRLEELRPAAERARELVLEDSGKVSRALKLIEEWKIATGPTGAVEVIAKCQVLLEDALEAFDQAREFRRLEARIAKHRDLARRSKDEDVQIDIAGLVGDPTGRPLT